MSGNLWPGTWRGRSPAGDVHRRAREVISPSGGIVRGKFPSRKNGRMVHHEGLLELDAIYLFETSPRIAKYREQPPTISYPDGTRLRRYTPDFELLLASGEIILVEVKPQRSLADDEVRHKLDCVTGHLQRSLQPFVILTDEAIRQEPRQSNLRTIYHRAARIPPSLTALEAALDQHRRQFPASIQCATELFLERMVDPYCLLMAGLLRCQLDQPISADTHLQLSEENNDDWFCIAPGHGF